MLLGRPARERADRLAELLRASDRRHPSRTAPRPGRPGAGRHDHPVAGDLLDPPGARAEQERLPGARLVDHLLVELADAAAVGQRDRVQPAVGNRAGVGDRELPGAGPRTDRAADAIPHDPRAQLGKLGGRVAAVEHVEHVLELGAAQLGVRVGAGDQRVQVVDADRTGPRARPRRSRRSAARARRAGCAVRRSSRSAPSRIRRATTAHSSRSARNLGKIRPRLTAPTEWPGAADPLQPARDGLRRLDLDHEVDRAHVDPELERRGRHQARQLAGLQHLLDDEPLLARERSVVGAGDLRALGGSSFSRSASRSAPRRLLTNTIVERCASIELEQLGVDRRPDRAAGRLAARERVEVGARARRRARPSTRPAPWISRSSGLRTPVSTIRQLRDGPTRKRADLLERLLRRRQPDPLELVPGGLVEPLERQRQVRAALGRGDRVDLVDDAPARAVEQLLGAGGQHQVERLGRRDQDVRRLAQHRLALALGRVPGAHRDLADRRRSRAAARAGCDRCRRRGPSAARRRRARCGARRRAVASCSAASRSIAHRNAASVLPDPVGADSSTCSPEAIAGQAWSCAAVGSANAPRKPVSGAGRELLK